MLNLNRVNIFIAHTPLQNFIAAKIVEEVFLSQTIVNHLFTSAQGSNHANFNHYFLIEKKGLITKCLATYKAKRRITSILKEGNVNIFIPHTGALLDNYFFYTFPWKKYNTSINFYYEGILYFYEYEEPFFWRKHLSRRVFGLLTGLRYVYEPRIFPAHSDDITKIYTILPEFTSGPAKKMVKISLLKKSYTPNTDTILILGGKPSLLSNEEVIQLYASMLALTHTLSSNPMIYFKGHHADKSQNFENANNNRYKYEDITQPQPVEAIIEEYSPGWILSYPSSGLINLKEMYGSKINMISFYNKQKLKHILYLKDIFAHQGIEIKLI